MKKIAVTASAVLLSLTLAAGSPSSAEAKNAFPQAPANKIIAKLNDRNPQVRTIEWRLSKLGFLPGNRVDGFYDGETVRAVLSFQVKHRLSQTGTVDLRTHQQLIKAKAAADQRIAKARAARKAAAQRKAAQRAKSAAKLDSRCRTGRAVCIDKSQRKLWWVVNGRVVRTFDVRTGRAGMRTRSGSWRVYMKSRNHYSTLYRVRMPFAMFFSGGQAVHYSAQFARIGYRGGGSHGCVNLRDYRGAAWLFRQVHVGDKVIVTA